MKKGLAFKRGIHSEVAAKTDDENIKSFTYQNTSNLTNACIEPETSCKLFFPKSKYEATTLENVERNFLENLDERGNASQKKLENSGVLGSVEYEEGDDPVSQSGFAIVPSQNFSKRLGSELSRAFDFGALYNYFGSEEIIFQASPVANALNRIRYPKRSSEYWYYYCAHEGNSVKNTTVPGLKVETQSSNDKFAVDIFSAVERYNRLVSDVHTHSAKYIPEDHNDNEES
eukprot:jgi/Galph1/2922/GphlegSOOS_G1555.1